MTQLHVSVDSNINCGAVLYERCKRFVTATIDSSESLVELTEFINAIHNGNPVSLASQSGPIDLGSGFCRVRLTIPYLYNSTKLRSGEMYGDIFDKSGILHISDWIPAIFSRCYPTKSLRIAGELSRLLDTGNNYSSKLLVLSCWNGEVISVATGITPPLTTDDNRITYSSDRLFAMPFDGIDNDSMLIASAAEPIPDRWSRREFYLNGQKSRVVIGKNYLRYNSLEFNDDTLTLLLHTEEMESKFGIKPSLWKSKAFDYRMSCLLCDVPNNKRTLDMDYVTDGNMISNLPDVTANGIVLNTDMWDSTKYFNRIPLTEDDIHAARHALFSVDSAYKRSAIGLSFKEYFKKKKQKIELFPFAGGSLGMLTKSDEKKETEEKTFKTRVLTSISSYLMSIAYSIILHNDLAIPENCNLDALGMRRMFVRNRRKDFYTESFSIDKYLTQNQFVFGTAAQDNIKKNITSFVSDYQSRSMIVSPSGNFSVISVYFYSTQMTAWSRDDGREYNWIVSLDSSAHVYYNRAFASLARGNSNGFNSDTQAISGEYFLKLLRYTDVWAYDPYTSGNDATNVSGEEIHKYRAEFSRKLQQFYLDNVIGISAIDELFSSASSVDDYIPRIRGNSGIEIKYVELFTLQEDSMSILRAGYSSKSLESILGWWATISECLRTKAMNNRRYSRHELSMVKYLLDSTDYVVTCLTDRVDQLV